MDNSIELINVSKKYRIGQSPLSIRSLFANHNGQEQHHWAVRDINFALKQGEALGIIGPNGAGKTTILKLLSRVTYPTHGRIHMKGRFSALIELGAGFHPDLTGRENVFLNGIILGMKKAEIQRRFDEIVEFAGISNYIDTPVKRYSSGMYARLGFAVAAHVDPEILLVDEVLAVGDMAFQRKCYDRMLDMIEHGTTLIFVSHNMRAVQRVCARCLVLYRGQIAYLGESAEATAEYSNILRIAASERSKDTENVQHGIAEQIMTHDAVIESVQLLRDNEQPARTFHAGEAVFARAVIHFNADAPAPVIACTIRSPEGQVIYDYTTHWADVQTPHFNKNSRVVIEFPLRLNLAQGTYFLGINLAYEDLSRYYDRIDRALDFVISSKSGAKGIADLQAEFKIRQISNIEDKAQ
ncbi:MAG: ABC transporter ATP-binding protein [Chloroflexota bacterium]